MNSLETQLRLWKPRGPSAALKRRLFGRSAPRSGMVAAFSWLAPVAACALLALTVIIQGNGLGSRESRSEPMMAMLGSNQTLVAGYSNGLAFTGSNSSAAAFESTNRSVSTSSSGSFLPLR